MKTFLLFGVVALFSTSSALAVAKERTDVRVPAQFQGEWRVNLTECPPAITDRPIWINPTMVRLDHSIGEVRVVKHDGEREVTIAGELLSDGDPWNAKLRLKLSDTGGELTISEGGWSVKLQRCPD